MANKEENEDAGLAGMAEGAFFVPFNVWFMKLCLPITTKHFGLL